MDIELELLPSGRKMDFTIFQWGVEWYHVMIKEFNTVVLCICYKQSFFSLWRVKELNF